MFAKVDTEAEEQLAVGAGIRSIPTLMVFGRGTLVFNQAGALPPDALENLVNQVIELDVEGARRTGLNCSVHTDAHTANVFG